MDGDDALVAVQAAALLALAAPGRARWALPPVAVGASWVAVVTGGALSAWAAAAHGSRLTPRVTPPADAVLLEDGAYAVSRHPVYAGLLVAAGGVAVLRRRRGAPVAWVALAAVLAAKTRREERRLLERFGDRYAAYRDRTPFLLGRPAAA